MTDTTFTEVTENTSDNKTSTNEAIATLPVTHTNRKTREDVVREMKEHYIDVLMGQTTWTREEAREKLEANNYNVQTCVRLFMGLPAEKPNLSVVGATTNQAIYGNIRGLMDEASRRYERKKEMEAKLQSAREAYQIAQKVNHPTQENE